MAGRRRAMELVFLGTAANPSPRRNSSCVLLKIGKIMQLFDCAEGSFRQLQESRHSGSAIDRIFITHMHGDHVWGLPALLCAAKFRVNAEIYGPQGIRDWLRMSLKSCRAKVPSKYKVHELILTQEKSLERVASLHVPANPHDDELPGNDISCSGDGVWHVLQDETLDIKAGLLTHNVPCWGYVLTEVKSEAEKESAGETTRGSRKVVILGDTANSKALTTAGRDADVVVHEATLGNCNKETHSTPEMAGSFAKSMNAKVLVLTHLNRNAGTSKLPATAYLDPAKRAFGRDSVVLAEDFLSLSL
ncbi:hypothetical protein SELMODRAFT_444530 [Selaginella moellendorffii]|uniref:Metallo-beta-lactamase domain-containing protein n=2 Tax=Selaginella moellendorffii TaxID=88036 RepID=D8SAG9_SELML|nr:zinc phosphodiesterase ELAC protein 1 isoform X1 [Selaginella moellendorffii]EFJ18754.1 hypothetical protein SELMODRAFT_444530 [Selaginella moellendorffii]|eukprot:XP_002980494.1 zinc phosphodiesterase ELAC protein 1 isoform X1 [Selaginella moellendorffii]